MNPYKPEKPIENFSPDQVRTLLSSQELFKNLESSILEDLCSDSHIIQLEKEEVLIQQGDPGDSVYVLLQGNLGVEKHNPDGSTTRLDEVDPGTMVGEMALLTGQNRSATVWALVDCLLVRISREDVDHLIRQHPQVSVEFERILVPRLRRTQLSAILQDLFSDLDLSTFQDLQSRMEWRQLAGGDVVYQQGESGDAMVIVVNGRLKMVTESLDGDEHLVGELRRGSYAGGYVLLTGEAYRETVSAMRDSDIVLLSQEVFRDFVEQNPSAVLQIARSIATQQQPTLRSLSKDSSRQISLAVLPCTPQVLLKKFTQKMVQSLKELGATLHLNSDRFDDRYGMPGAAQTPPTDPIHSSITAWLSEQEAHHAYVVYEAEPEWNYWTQRCLRQADRIILVAQAEDDPHLGQLELALQELGAQTRQELVLLQPAATKQPTETRQWLSNRKVHRHHHIRIDNVSDFNHLARMLIGRPTGLVLSGGGARGIAHLGVYRALLEFGIDIDLVGGTSIGALAAGTINLYDNPETLVHLAERYFSSKMLHDYTLPVSSLLASKKVSRVLQAIFGDTQIEDLWRPYFCISSNLTRSEMVIHRRGDLWKAVRASSAIPGVFAPVSYEGDILVDGGAMNHFPVDIMRAECEGGTVIAVNASPSKEGAPVWDFGSSISGWEVLWNKINPFGRKEKVPSLFSIITRSTNVHSKSRLQEISQLADVLIEPDTSQYGVMEWSLYKGLIEAGYQAGTAKLQEQSIFQSV